MQEDVLTALRRRTLMALAGPALLAGTRPGRAAAPIGIGSKIDTEGLVLGEIFAARLEAQGIAVRRRLGLGPTRILRRALLAGAVDLVPEYTGNGAQFFHREGESAWHDPARAWALVRRLDAPLGLVWLPPAPAQNGWGIAVRRDLARAARLTTLADLARALREGVRLRLAASVEFVESADALPAFERAYGFHLEQAQLLMLAGGDTAATLRAASEHISEVNAAMAYGTDGALAVLDLVLLGDPARAELAFQPAPVIRAQALAAVPGVPAALAPTVAALSTDVLRRLNAEVAAEGRDPASVARAFLAGVAG